MKEVQDCGTWMELVWHCCEKRMGGDSVFNRFHFLVSHKYIIPLRRIPYSPRVLSYLLLKNYDSLSPSNHKVLLKIQTYSKILLFVLGISCLPTILAPVWREQPQHTVLAQVQVVIRASSGFVRFPFHRDKIIAPFDASNQSAIRTWNRLHHIWNQAELHQPR